MRAIFNRQVATSQDCFLQTLLNRRDFAERMSRHPMHARLLDGLPNRPGDRVLELGCGPGKYIALLSTLGFRVIGTDPLEFPTWQTIRKRTNAELMSRIVAEQLPFPDASFDHVVCLGALLYFNDPDLAFHEMRRVIKLGGRLVLRTVNRDNFYTSVTGKRLDPASKHLYTTEELKNLVSRHGFSVVRNFTFGFWPPLFTTAWWYLTCVCLPLWPQTLLSALTPPRRRVNITIFAIAADQTSVE